MTDQRLELLIAQFGNLKGQIVALQHATQVLLAMSPDRDAAIRAILEELDRGVSLAIQDAVDDPWIDGIEQSKSLIVPSPRLLALFQK